MTSITEFFGMGGYAGYIWPSYVVTLVLMAGLLIISRHQLRRNERTYKMLDDARSKDNKDGTIEKKT